MAATLNPGPLQEFLTIVRRDLGADDARIERAKEADAVRDAPGTFRRALPFEHCLVIQFSPVPEDVDARLRRLDMLLSSFSAMLGEKLSALHEPAQTPTGARAQPAESLHEELAALAMRAGAMDALVIDAHSPIVWGAAVEDPAAKEGETAAEGAPEKGASVLSLELERARRKSPQADRKGGAGWVEPFSNLSNLSNLPMMEAMPHTPSRESISARVLERVRALPEVSALPKGGHLRVSASEPEFGYSAHSFAGIYVLILVFRGGEPMDELGIKRALVNALPVIERLVLSLPPLDPVPVAGAAAMPRRRRRR